MNSHNQPEKQSQPEQLQPQPPPEKKRVLSTKEIRSFFYSEIGEMKRCVSLSRKGKPRKNTFGMHTFKPYIKNLPKKAMSLQENDPVDKL